MWFIQCSHHTIYYLSTKPTPSPYPLGTRYIWEEVIVGLGFRDPIIIQCLVQGRVAINVMYLAAQSILCLSCRNLSRLSMSSLLCTYFVETIIKHHCQRSMSTKWNSLCSFFITSVLPFVASLLSEENLASPKLKLFRKQKKLFYHVWTYKHKTSGVVSNTFSWS